jgi:hypothetical protein
MIDGDAAAPGAQRVAEIEGRDIEARREFDNGMRKRK